MRRRDKYLKGMPESQKETINLLLSGSMDLLASGKFKSVADYNNYYNNCEDALFHIKQLVRNTVDVEDGIFEIEQLLEDLQFTEKVATLGYIIGYLRALHDSIED